MLKPFRQKMINQLWGKYGDNTPQMRLLERKLNQKGITKLHLDHFAVIDLPSPNTGISHLRQIFSSLGYMEQGRDYLADKQNDFLWMTEEDSMQSAATDVLPQVVVADFRMDELPPEVKKIIAKYANQTQPSLTHEIERLTAQLRTGDESTLTPLNKRLINYFAGREWPLPTTAEFYTVQAFNELLAWVLIFGRRPNHFTLAVHLLNHFTSLDAFHRFVEDDAQLPLNADGGVIKGGQNMGIAQGSTKGVSQSIKLQDGEIEIPTGFVEFVWRYPKCDKKPVQWGDYFTGFIAQHADRVIESLYSRDLEV